MTNYWKNFWDGARMGVNPLNWGTALKKDGMGTLSVCSEIKDPIAGLVCGFVCPIFTTEQDPHCLSAKVAGGVLIIAGLGWFRIPFLSDGGIKQLAAGCAWMYFWDPNVLDEILEVLGINQTHGPKRPALKPKYGVTHADRVKLFDKGVKTPKVVNDKGDELPKVVNEK